jgi:hypothetical protein
MVRLRACRLGGLSILRSVLGLCCSALPLGVYGGPLAFQCLCILAVDPMHWLCWQLSFLLVLRLPQVCLLSTFGFSVFLVAAW